jgi:DNA-binding GntR family transcriptional regulator
MEEKASKRNFPEKQNLSEDLVLYIKQQIIDGELNPGDRIVETKLARELGISQTPVREAIRQLMGEGIITIAPNRGPLVRSLNMKDVFEIYSLRAMLEGLSIRLATQNATEEDIIKLEHFYQQMKEKLHDDSVNSLLQDSLYIHQSIINLSNHSRLISMYKSINFQISLVNRILGRKSTKQKELDQHWELIEALVQRDPDKAEKVMREHIYRSYREFVELKEIKNSESDDTHWLNLWF